MSNLRTKVSLHGKMMHGIAVLACVAFGGSFTGTSAVADESPSAVEFSPAAIEFFEKKVRPILANRCLECHGRDSEEDNGGLLITSHGALLRGGDTGPAIVPGKPQESLLVDAINYGDLYEMPPKSRLPKAEITVLERWVKMGAPWPKEDEHPPVDAEDIESIKDRLNTHWVWQPIKSPTPPVVKNSSWPRDDIDRFILARIEQANLKPALPADRATLLRRVYFDLIGLPPSPTELSDFLADESESAWQTVVDRLLDSPRFGEKWGRHWLDLMRYGDTRGHEFDNHAPNAYQYRDYIIRALNADVPYDQFVTEHIAGDLLEKPRMNKDEGFNESILATGFWFLGEWVHSPVDIRLDETDRFDNMIDVMGKAFLGLTIGCARCHDHKFDALSQADYYALAGFLQSSSYRLARFDSLDHNAQVAKDLHALRRQMHPQILAASGEMYEMGISQIADCLLAAKACSEIGSRVSDEELAEIAERFGVESRKLAVWNSHLVAAKNSLDSPLHFWAIAADRANAEKRWRELSSQWQREAQQSQQAWSKVRTIVDYRRLDPKDWMQDGHSFGLGPSTPGTLRFPGNKSGRVTLWGAAEHDLAWPELKVAAGSQKKSARAGGWVSAGQALRTPTFTLKSGRLHYLVRGNANVYAAVDSHRLNNGPLHGRVIKRWTNGDDQWRWVTHDLSTYPGHQVHIEFSPGKRGKDQTGSFALMAVVEADTPPPLPTFHHRRLLDRLLANSEIGDSRQLAAIYQQLFLDNWRQFQTQSSKQNTAATEIAHTVNWMMRHAQLFEVGNKEKRQPVYKVYKEFITRRDETVARLKRQSRLAMAMWDGSGVDESLLIRGNHRTPGKPVPRRFIQAVNREERPIDSPGSGRLQLAQQMVDPTNPLTSRVIVNRVWHHLTGRGIVATTDNFGALGERPTHPLLLDHLASRFMEDGWSLKRLIRSVVLSQTYQMSSVAAVDATDSDPSNLLLHRMRIRRLTAEAIRDEVLAVSARLDTAMYGPGVGTYLTPFMQGRGRPGSGPVDGNGRRSIYLEIRRNFLSPMMLAFDMPAPAGAVGRRNMSNVPAQALILLNDPFVAGQSEVWAHHVLAEAGLNDSQRINNMYAAAFSRPPRTDELNAALAFLVSQRAELAQSDRAKTDQEKVWADLAHVLFNVKEFIFIQ